MADSVPEEALRVTVAWSTQARQVQQVELLLPVGSTVATALQRAGLTMPAGGAVGIWGRRVALDRVLAPGDRLELYRPLRVDPKVARRERFQRQGTKMAGLFARPPAARKKR